MVSEVQWRIQDLVVGIFNKTFVLRVGSIYPPKPRFPHIPIGYQCFL